jgi:hypothetical protein
MPARSSGSTSAPEGRGALIRGKRTDGKPGEMSGAAAYSQRRTLLEGLAAVMVMVFRGRADRGRRA